MCAKLFLAVKDSAARRAEFGLVRLQADRDPVGIGDELAAQTENVRSARAASIGGAIVFGDGEARSGGGDENESDCCNPKHFHCPCLLRKIFPHS